MDKTDALKKIIDESKNLCVFTGAGISCPSGIPDFRSADGLYNRDSGVSFTPEQMVSHTFFEKHTEMFFDFYKQHMIYPDAKPNPAHRYFADLEQEGRTVSVVTQNIDGLHQAAGSSCVYELHGSVHRNYCTRCGRFYDLSHIAASDGIPRCDSDGAVIKPDVVLYEEPLDNSTVEQAVAAISAADTMIIVGTSLAVYPAASFIRFFTGEHLILINKSEVSCRRIAELEFHEDVVRVIERLVK